MRLNEEGESVVVVPSVTLDRVSAAQRRRSARQWRSASCSCCCCCENPACAWSTSRRCRSPRRSSSTTCRCCPESSRATRARRLSLVAVHDSSSRPLSEKLLDRPRLLRRIAASDPRSRRARISSPTTPRHWNETSPFSLGIPMYGADPRLFELGTKTGCRRLFAEEGVPSSGRLREPPHARRCRRRDRAPAGPSVPTRPTCIVKLNEGVSGEGNAHGRPVAASPVRARRTSALVIDERLRAMAFERPDTPFERLRRQARGTRRHRRGTHRRATSCAARASSFGCCPAGEVELLSTHDQLLGGSERAELPRLSLPGRLRLRPRHQRRGTHHRCPPRPGRRDRPLRARLRRGPGRQRGVVDVRHRDQPAQGRHDPSRSSPCSSSPTGGTTPRRACS